jgi:drug/metabolite transporter (DMT)-like permease
MTSCLHPDLLIPSSIGMFLGMLAALGMDIAVKYFRIPFPGYTHQSGDGKYYALTGEAIDPPQPTPRWMYLILVIPALFDLVATALCMFGLRYVNVSIYQMLRGGAIVFVAILKQFVLGHRLKNYQWIGVMWNVAAIVLVGLTAMLSASSEGPSDARYDNPLLGVMLILCGALVQSLQYAFEEKVMSMEIPATPLVLIGMEGFWGSLVCLLVLYPLANTIPGTDHGYIENYQNTIYMFMNSPDIQRVFAVYFISVFLYNILAALVTFMLNSVWHAILDNFRPISVWGTDLFIFYLITTNFGESWSVYSYIQVIGLFVLLYGTAIYNAPNPGSIRLTGDLKSLFLDFSYEYPSVEPPKDTTYLLKKTEAPATEGDTYLPYTSPFLGRRRTSEVPKNESLLLEAGNRGGFPMMEIRRGNSFRSN